MLQSAQALLSPIPSAFTALGVGTLFAIGPLSVVAAIDSEALFFTPKIGMLSNPNMPAHMQSAMPIVLGFSAIFFLYTFGLIFIHVGSLFRRYFWRGLDASRVAFVLNSNNEALHKLFFETRSSVSAMDGLAIALASLWLGTGIALALLSSWWFGVAGVILSVGNCYILLWQADRYLMAFDDIARRTKEYRT